MGGIESERVAQQPSDNAEGSVSSAAPPISIEIRPEVIEERIHQEDMS